MLCNGIETCRYKLIFNPILLPFNSSAYVNMKIASTKRYSILYNYFFLFKSIECKIVLKKKFFNVSYSNPSARAMLLRFGVYFSCFTPDVGLGGILLCVSLLNVNVVVFTSPTIACTIPRCVQLISISLCLKYSNYLSCACA